MPCAIWSNPGRSALLNEPALTFNATAAQQPPSLKAIFPYELDGRLRAVWVEARSFVFNGGPGAGSAFLNLGLVERCFRMPASSHHDHRRRSRCLIGR